MKQQILSFIKRTSQDRPMLIILSVFLLSCLASLIYIIVSVHQSELQVVVHYSSFGATNFYRDKWYYLFTFAAFIIVMAAVHVVITARLLNAKGREFAVSFVWLGFIMLFIAVSLFYQILKVASLS